jgi:protocatechuate 3,4-dioxygenase beta subunit
MDNRLDVGRVVGFTRRRVLAIGGLGALGLAGCGADDSSSSSGSSASSSGGVCKLQAEVTQGPYYLDGASKRADITEGKSGFPLNLTISVVNTKDSCAPVTGVAVEIWHCDAWGYYSGYTTAPPGGTAPTEDGVGDAKTYLRGYQVVDDSGKVTFATIVPGWYSPRAAHIHLKVHSGGTAGATYAGGKVVHTGQILLSDEVCAAYSSQAPYSMHQLTRTALVSDQVYNEAKSAGGDPTTMVPTFALITAGKVTDGYNGTITVGVDPSVTPTAGAGPSGMPSGGPPSPLPSPVQS